MPSHVADKHSLVEESSPAVRWLDAGVMVFLFIFAIFAPHSIAVTQSAWLLGMLLWLARFAFFPPPRFHRTPLDYALIGFFILSGLSAFLSYEPVVSIGKMRAASLFTIVYLVAQNVRTLRVARLLALALIASCTVNVLFTAGEMIVGRGVKLQGVKADSPLAKAIFHLRTIAHPTPIISGDTVFEVDGRRVGDPEELAAALAAGPTPGVSGDRVTNVALVKIYRVEWTPTLEVPRGNLLPGTTALDQLGIFGWTRGRDWRATGFFGHWVTYAEVLQLIASLGLGLFLALPRKRTLGGVMLVLALAGFGFALALTVTRASWVGFLVSAILMLTLSASRRTLLIVCACAIPVVLGGLFLLQQKRKVAFFDRSDGSTSWRETVWREGFHLLVTKPRHVLVGVGMDSIKGHWREWGLFDNGRLPMGHMHSNLLQIALERGVPTLIVWLLLLGLYARMLWRVLRRMGIYHGEPHGAEGAQNKYGNPSGNWIASIARERWMDRGITLGALGGLAGFFVSGVVHYNWGDSEVVMIFYFVMGLTLVIHREMKESR